MLRYELYDREGNLTFTSGLAGLKLDDETSPLCSQARQRSAARSRSIRAQDGTSPTNFASLTLPLALNGDPRGTLVVYLDQSDQADVLANYFGLGRRHHARLAWRRHRRARRASPGCADARRRKAEEQVRYLEEHDALTGLANRKAFIDSLAEAIGRMHRDRTHIAVLCLDIDKFKEINEAVDHSGGDQVSARHRQPHPVDTARERPDRSARAAMNSPLPSSTSPISAT